MYSRRSSTGAGCAAIAFLFLVMVPLSSILNGLVLAIMWGWFIVPIFHVGTLSIPLAIGLAMVVTFLTRQDTDDRPKKDHDSLGDAVLAATLSALAYPLIVLICAFLVHLFV